MQRRRISPSLKISPRRTLSIFQLRLSFPLGLVNSESLLYGGNFPSARCSLPHSRYYISLFSFLYCLASFVLRYKVSHCDLYGDTQVIVLVLPH